MYVGRTIDKLASVAYENWTMEELAYHRDTMNRFSAYLTDEGRQILDEVRSEISARGGVPEYGGGNYDHPASFHYD